MLSTFREYNKTGSWSVNASRGSDHVTLTWDAMQTKVCSIGSYSSHYSLTQEKQLLAGNIPIEAGPAALCCVSLVELLWRRWTARLPLQCLVQPVPAGSTTCPVLLSSNGVQYPDPVSGSIARVCAWFNKTRHIDDVFVPASCCLDQFTSLNHHSNSPVSIIGLNQSHTACPTGLAPADSESCLVVQSAVSGRSPSRDVSSNTTSVSSSLKTEVRSLGTQQSRIDSCVLSCVSVQTFDVL